MRKIVFTFIVAAVGFNSNSLFAVTKNLIDFNQFEQKIAADPAFAAPAEQETQGNTGEPAFRVTADDMKLDHWMVVFNSSAKQIQNLKYSYAKAVQTKGLVGGAPRTVLGARVHFPEWAHIASAQIAPPYELPAYSDKGELSSIENGLVDNTGDILSITAEVYGRNFDYAFYLQLRNENGDISKYYLGQLLFNGWRKLTWKNPVYIDNVDIREIKRLPIFPDKGLPYQKLDSFLIVKNQYNPGGNYLFYIANVAVEYDLAVLVEDEDIDQEASWNILSDTMKVKIDAQNKKRADFVELKKQEEKRMTLSRGVSTGGDNAQPAGAAAPAA